MSKNFCFGYIYDDAQPKVISRDLRAANIPRLVQTTKPEKWDNSHLGIPMLQGNIGSCVANAVAHNIYSSQNRLGYNPKEIVSRLFVYYGARGYHYPLDQDTGCQIRDAFRTINKHGFLEESEYSYKYDISKFREKPSRLDMAKAYENKEKAGVTGYYKISEVSEARINAIESFVSSGHVISFGVPITEDFYTGKTAVLQAANYDLKDVVGMHAMNIVGYDRPNRVFKCANWWPGRQEVFVSYPAVTQWHVWDLWLIHTTHKPTVKQTSKPKNPPSVESELKSEKSSK